MVQFVMKVEGVSLRHAVELLSGNIELGGEGKIKPVKRSSQCKLSEDWKNDGEDEAMLQRVVNFYHRILLESPEALSYLKQRGLDNKELISHFKLGFSNRSLGYRLPPKQTVAGKKIRSQLQNMGVLRQTGHEHFNGSLVIPVIENGAIKEMYGRKITSNLRKGTPNHCYLPSAHQGVFNQEGLKNTEEVILCESLIDALSFYVTGYRHVTSSYGVNGFTDEMLDTFKEFNIKRLLIAYDRDNAGDQASVKLAKRLMDEGFDCYRINFPKGMDANETMLKMTPAVESLGLVILQAQWMGNGKATMKPATKVGNFDDVFSAEDLLKTHLTEEATKIKNDTEQQSLSSLAAHSDASDITKNEPVKVIPVSPVPPKPKMVEADIKPHEIIITLGDRRYRIRDLDKNKGYQQLKVNILVSREDLFHVDTLDMRLAKARFSFIKQVSAELCYSEDVIKKDLGKLYLKLEELQEQMIKQAKDNDDSAILEIPEDEKQCALAFLKCPELLDKILEDFNQCGVVGEQTNKLVGYLACVSRKLDKPLAVVIQSSSAAGKSSLMDAVLDFMPEEERVQYSAMTGQSLFYMGESELKHKILAIAEEEGVRQASYALKLLQSQGVVTIASTGKDETTGELRTRPYKVEGPVMLFMTTTATDVDEELMNRCLVLTVNESMEQTQSIHDLQRMEATLEGLMINENYGDILKRHHNAQRLLKPLKIVNPYAQYLTFASHQTRMRRDHSKYLSLINSIAFLHQYQREIKKFSQEVCGKIKSIEYIEVTLSDIAIANQLAHEVLGRSLDELPPQTRRLLDLTYQMVLAQCQSLNIAQMDCRFSRKDVRNYTHWGDTQTRVHLERLVSMEYLIVHNGTRGKTFVYELVYQGEAKQNKPFVMGLIDVEQLKTKIANNNQNNTTTSSKRGKLPKLAVAKRGQNGAKAVGLRTGKIAENQDSTSDHKECIEKPEKCTAGAKNNHTSYQPAI